jgi:hypothetical protein
VDEAVPGVAAGEDENVVRVTPAGLVWRVSRFPESARGIGRRLSQPIVPVLIRPCDPLGENITSHKEDKDNQPERRHLYSKS